MEHVLSPPSKVLVKTFQGNIPGLAKTSMDMSQLTQWAQRSGQFPGSELQCIQDLADLIGPLCQPPDSLKDCIKIDEGAFGTIEKAICHSEEKVSQYILMSVVGMLCCHVKISPDKFGFSSDMCFECRVT